MERKYTWHKIAGHINELDFAGNNIAVIELKGTKTKDLESVRQQAFDYSQPATAGFLTDQICRAIGGGLR